MPEPEVCTQEVSYFFCHKCRLYTPAWHPGAVRWFQGHISCTEDKPQRHILNGTEALVVGQRAPASSLSMGPNPPEGYSCDPELGPLEELAFCTKPGHRRLT